MDGPLHEGQYQLTVTPALTDTVGTPWTATESMAGDPYTRTFYVDLLDGFTIENRGNNTLATATALTLTGKTLLAAGIISLGV